MTDILLVTFNARYSHTAFGLRYLLANLGELQERARLVEFSLEHSPSEALEVIWQEQPRIVGISVYIWNATLVTSLARLIKQVMPQVWVVMGGPEISWQSTDHPANEWADYIIPGEGEVAFARLCRQLLAGQPPGSRLLPPELPHLTTLKLPYDLYSDEDIRHREIYVESNRGCPYRCTFCLSALDHKVRRFNAADFLMAMETLLQRGVRRFKFVDRSFNLDGHRSEDILAFFLERQNLGFYLHLEFAPEKISPAMKSLLAAFQPGCLQLEVGVQSMDPAVRQAIQRPGDIQKVEENIRWLATHTHAHLHADLIVGLPGEGIHGFAKGFNRLLATGVHEIQVGILKRLSGMPMAREEGIGEFNPDPPYTLLCNDLLDFSKVRRLERFARYWDRIANSGHFPHTRSLLGEFWTFLAYSDWLFERIHSTHGIALERLHGLLLEGLPEIGLEPAQVGEALESDRRHRERIQKKKLATPKRQQQHQQEGTPG
ncbi:MAG: radical SAM protein [Magnetococcales bacterium]|nr:cobalamin-dependent protein [Magnetococcales bacterium]NGZ27228.1 radical SAM protein [Magnetococcales bacterium]